VKSVPASLDADSGVVEIAKRGDDPDDHGYFLGVRPDVGNGAFVALTRGEAAAVAQDLTDVPVPARVTDAMVEAAAVARWESERLVTGRLPWADMPDGPGTARDDERIWARVAVAAALEAAAESGAQCDTGEGA
jgi:hypothetical protein